MFPLKVEERRLQTERELIKFKVQYQSLERSYQTMKQSYKRLKVIEEFILMTAKFTYINKLIPDLV